MGTNRLVLAAVGSVVFLEACGGPIGRLDPLVPLPARTELPAPSSAGAPPVAPAAPVPAAPAPSVAAPSGQQSGATFVGGKVRALKADLQRLQQSVEAVSGEFEGIRSGIDDTVRSYHGRVAAIRARLQRGTTPGNPELTREWQAAQEELEAVNGDVGRLNALAGTVSADAALAAYLLETARVSYAISGATEEDHRGLGAVEGDVGRAVVRIDRLLGELSDDIRRHTRSLATERSDLMTLALAVKNAEYLGPNLSPGGAPAPPARAVPSGSTERIDEREALVVIRFDRPDVRYRQALYTAVREVLDRKPDAGFDLVAVSALAGGEAQAALDVVETRRNAEGVLRALVEMGVPADGLTISATTSSTGGNEVRLYVR